MLGTVSALKYAHRRDCSEFYVFISWVKVAGLQQYHFRDVPSFHLSPFSQVLSAAEIFTPTDDLTTRSRFELFKILQDDRLTKAEEKRRSHRTTTGRRHSSKDNENQTTDAELIERCIQSLDRLSIPQTETAEIVTFLNLAMQNKAIFRTTTKTLE
jgi:hypothetical protein